MLLSIANAIKNIKVVKDSEYFLRANAAINCSSLELAKFYLVRLPKVKI